MAFSKYRDPPQKKNYRTRRQTDDEIMGRARQRQKYAEAMEPPVSSRGMGFKPTPLEEAERNVRVVERVGKYVSRGTRTLIEEAGVGLAKLNAREALQRERRAKILKDNTPDMFSKKLRRK